MSFVKDTFFGGAEKKAARAAQAAAAQAEEGIESRFQETKELLSPFVSGGLGAFEREQALSGALGPEAQAEAFQAFNESPGQQFLREEGLRLLESQQAATGGLGSGERLRELVRFGTGLAQQDFSNQFNRLANTARAGLSAASALGGVGTSAAANAANALTQGAATSGELRLAGADSARKGIGAILGGFI